METNTDINALIAEAIATAQDGTDDWTGEDVLIATCPIGCNGWDVTTAEGQAIFRQHVIAHEEV